MLTIRAEQMALLREARVREALHRMADELRRTWSELCAHLNDAELREFGRRGTDAAERFDLTLERDIMTFLVSQLLFGVNFVDDPAYPWAAELRWPYLPGRIKGEHLRDHLVRLSNDAASDNAVPHG